MDRRAFFTSLHHGNLAFDVMACSAIGGVTLGLYFFVLDAIDGRALYTPMLLGSVLFEGASVESVTRIEAIDPDLDLDRFSGPRIAASRIDVDFHVDTQIEVDFTKVAYN